MTGTGTVSNFPLNSCTCERATNAIWLSIYRNILYVIGKNILLYLCNTVPEPEPSFGDQFLNLASVCFLGNQDFQHVSSLAATGHLGIRRLCVQSSRNSIEVPEDRGSK